MPAHVAGLCTHRLHPQHTGTTGSKGRDRGSPRAGVLLHRHTRCGSRYRSGRASRPRARCPQAPVPSAGARVVTAVAVRSGTQKQPPTLHRVPAPSSHQPPASQSISPAARAGQTPTRDMCPGGPASPPRVPSWSWWCRLAELRARCGTSGAQSRAVLEQNRLSNSVLRFEPGCVPS